MCTIEGANVAPSKHVRCSLDLCLAWGHGLNQAANDWNRGHDVHDVQPDSGRKLFGCAEGEGAIGDEADDAESDEQRNSVTHEPVQKRCNDGANYAACDGPDQGADKWNLLEEVASGRGCHQGPRRSVCNEECDRHGDARRDSSENSRF